MIRLRLQHALWFCVGLALPCIVYAQSGSSAPETATEKSSATYQSQSVIRATTRLVILDAVATDDKGHPVSDLKAEDFTVLENGKPQKVISFRFQQSKPITRTVALPPNVVTNAPQYSGNGSLNVILLDAINSDFSNHVYAQDMLIKYLETGPAIQPTAVYALEGKLTLLHDFTTDTKALRDVLVRFKPQGPTHIPDVYAAATAVFNPKGSFQASVQGRDLAINAMRFLGHALTGYPGRKNLIWLADGFPFNLFPDIMLSESVQGVPNGYSYSPEVAKITDELMNAQIAVYPIDAAGVNQGDSFPAHASMRSMSERTGGKTFFNRNDIDMGVRTSIDDGSTYYTLEYYPEDRKWNGKFRTIEIKLARPKVDLQYRRGYYAVGPDTTVRDNIDRVSKDLSSALVMDAPASTGVMFQAAAIAPTEKNQNKVLVNFAIDPHTIAFEQRNDDLQHASIGCVVWAYPEKGNPIKSEGETANAALKPAVFQQLMKANFPCRQTITLKPGRYTLRLGVIDRTTNLIGTASSSVTVP